MKLVLSRSQFSGRFPGPGSRRGIALMLVIFAVTFIGLIVVSLLQISQFSWEESSLERGKFQAKILAESGVAMASHPKIERGDPLLRREYPDGRKLEVRITSEGGRILVSTLSEPLFIETTQELFIRWGLDATQAATAAESLADWVDSDREARTNGAETDFYTTLEYPDFPANEPFTNLDQMLLVRGMDQVAKVQPRWRDYFTLYGDGTIDVNAAPADLIEAFFGSTPDAALSLVGTRAGNDLIEGTEDDYRFESFDEVKVLLGMAEDQWSRVSADISLENATRRIESTASIGDTYVYRLIVLTEGADDKSVGTPVARINE
ncbi:MAG: general secretion pathway protein GspK [Verrucomicrobiae bacterium]|nr:general secretion pathway protein GspK [Verrucomicrobiae bacterium]